MTAFWDDSEEFRGPPLTDQMVRDAESQLHYKLPKAYVALLMENNGGTPVKTCFPTSTPTSWAPDHIAISGIVGIGGEWGIDSPTLGSEAMIREWGYPAIGIVVCQCPSAGHEAVMLDYSVSGNQGEPRVVYVEARSPPRVTVLSASFESFIADLMDEATYGREV
jgi:SMI1-KNR4 cell-wall